MLLALEHARHDERGALALRGVRQAEIGREPGHGAVLAERCAERDGVGRGLDTGGVDGLQEGDVVEDRVELTRHACGLVAGEREARQRGHALDLLARDTGHREQASKGPPHAIG